MNEAHFPARDLIAPAVCGILTVRLFGARLAVGVVLSLIGGVAGLILSYYKDLPSGAAIVCVFGGLLVMAGIASAFTTIKGGDAETE